MKKRSWSVSELDPPWGSRPSIYWHIANNIQEDTLGLLKGAEELPDEELVRGDHKIGFAAGAMDAVFGSAATGKVAQKRISHLYSALVTLMDERSSRNLTRLYSILTSEGIISIVDELLETIVKEQPRNQDHLHTLARWLAMESPDREVVKFAIAIIGLFRDENDLDILMTLGRHEEFTVFVAVAIQNLEVDVDDKLWKLAQHVNGWGRINIVDRLGKTRDPYIKDWLLREGYRNEIMHEHTALTCARAGELPDRLKKNTPDDELIRSAGEILTAILSGSGPAEGYESYPEAADTIETYLEILEDRKNSLDALVFADRVERFLSLEDNVTELSPEIRSSWDSRRIRMLAAISVIKRQPGWMDKVRVQLESTDQVDFWVATEAALVLGLDTWDKYFERIKKGEDYWWNALQTDQPDRIDQLIKHAEATIPLESIATGPSDEMGFGDEFVEHCKLDWLLQGLKRFPGKGIRLIEAGLQSPVIRNRNMALSALSEVPVADRSEDLKLRLSRALSVEPDEDVKQRLEAVIEGRPISD